MSDVIDIHTHAFGKAWLDLLVAEGGPDYGTARMADDREYLVEKGVPASMLQPEAFDYDVKLQQMDRFGIDLAIVSLTSPNVFWGGEGISAEAARRVNDDMAGG